MKGEIILENGDRCEFYLEGKILRKLTAEAEEMSDFNKKQGYRERYDMATALFVNAILHIEKNPDPDTIKDSPGAATPRESE